jgi:hypothetical protein
MAETATPEANIVTMRKALATMASKDIDACVEMLTPDFKINIVGVPFQATGHAAWISNARTIIQAFPDLEIQIDDIFGADDKVAVRARLRGTIRGLSSALRQLARASVTKATRSTGSRAARSPRSGSVRT